MPPRPDPPIRAQPGSRRARRCRSVTWPGAVAVLVAIVLLVRRVDARGSSFAPVARVPIPRPVRGVDAPAPVARTGRVHGVPAAGPGATRGLAGHQRRHRAGRGRRRPGRAHRIPHVRRSLPAAGAVRRRRGSRCSRPRRRARPSRPVRSSWTGTTWVSYTDDTREPIRIAALDGVRLLITGSGSDDEFRTLAAAGRRRRQRAELVVRPAAGDQQTDAVERGDADRLARVVGVRHPGHAPHDDRTGRDRRALRLGPEQRELVGVGLHQPQVVTVGREVSGTHDPGAVLRRPARCRRWWPASPRAAPGPAAGTAWTRPAPATAPGRRRVGPDAGSTLGPPGANEQLRVIPANSRTMATSTATAPAMSRTDSAERGGLPGGPGSAGPDGEALLTPPIVPV